MLSLAALRAPALCARSTLTLSALTLSVIMAHLGFGDPIKQYPGQVQVTRAVKVQAPGKHFNNLTPTEAKQSYWVVATEHRERYNFEKH